MTKDIVLRYLFSKHNRHLTRVVRITLTLALSTVIMLTILSIMDYMQSQQLDAVKQTRSFPVTVMADTPADAEALAGGYSKYAEVFAYKETFGLIDDGVQTRGVSVRYIDSSYDGGLFTTGSVPESGIFLPYRLYCASPVSSVFLSVMEEGRVARLVPRTYEYPVQGFFQTRLSAFDSSVVFLPLDLADSSLAYTVAFTDLKVSEETLASMLSRDGWDPVLWSEREGTLYSSLILEKTVMSVLLLSLYLIVSVQIAQGAAALAQSKKREIAAFYLMGIGKNRLAAKFAAAGPVLILVSSLTGLVMTLCLLAVLPHALGLLSGVRFSVDILWFAALTAAMMMLSFAAWFYEFRIRCGEKSIMEVLSAV